MAITLTTLTGAVIIDQNTIAVTSATGFAAGSIVLIDQESMQVQKGYPASGTSILQIPVLRGLDGTATTTHANAAQVKVGTAADFLGPASQESTIQVIGGPARTRVSISATGAIPIPLPGSDLDVVLNGTTIIAGTLANPTTDMDGCRLTIMGNGKAAHTVTYTAGLGNVGAAADVLTFKADQSQSVTLVACGGFWTGHGTVAAGATIAGVGIG
jgi:hypothetical protein